MAWRIHLANQAIQNLQILPTKPPILAAWTSKRRLHYYDLNRGLLLSERVLPSPPKVARTEDDWQSYVAQLTSPENNVYLPYVRMRSTDMYSTDDGKLRLYRDANDRIAMETDGIEEELSIIGGERFISVDLDRALGTVVGLDESLKLHIYQQNIRVGAFELGLENDTDLRPNVVVSRGGGNIYATDGRSLVSADTSGTVLKKLDLHYYVGRMTCSPGGGMVITTDMESGVMRIYRGETLTLTHQKFVIDLVTDATQIQLLADLPPTTTAISAIAAYNRGVIAFAMSGVICVTDVESLDEVPRPKALL